MKLTSFFLQPFTLINSPKQKLILIGICFGFGIIFTNIFIPFNVDEWESDTGLEQFLRLTNYSLIAALSLLFMQFVIRKVFKVLTFTAVWRYMLWFLGEVCLISIIYLLVYNDNLTSVWEQFKFTFKHTLLGISIPYFIALVILALIQSRNEKTVTKEKVDLIGIPDENGVIKISLQLPSILYLESADNYVVIFYLDQEEVKRILIRNSLKKLEALFASSILKRCHRSYIVNVKNIKLIEKASRKYLVHIKNTDTIIPISKNYIPEFSQMIF
ncbi:LytTR family DNA-binding domain-containing protein [Tamlana sp. 2201CG12-4]|uniref:LytR/AlgR family response regulator transcription factor n=1 Tax=Tamlana sp. 2201CG12-4 TaxID=3112582 RepID=UPI002DBC05D4|nr:LytTR family DNA-binding domain-containing protein [Tamlana sp. 2201CG12-4]MEC3908076.1 LytTR family DNA-binding domain-containing protein [Tamlana sp. 2201CG12-4]